MKNLFKLLPCALLALTAAACNDDDNTSPAPELRVLTFEDSDYKGTDNGGKGFADWSSLIDDPQYNGPLLYPSTAEWLYNWNDDNNTFLASELVNNYNDNKFWGGGGHAVSNYADTDLTHKDFNYQLAVYGTAGHDGSQNFCIHNGSDQSGDMDKLASFYFKDGIERIVDHMWVTNTAYTLSLMQQGDTYGNLPFGADDYLRIVAIGLNLEGKETGRTSFDLAKGTDFVTEWTKWNLASLGKVARIAFNMEGSQTSEWGLNTPAYFAYDDVAVRF